MKCDKSVMRLYAVTDRTWTGEKTLYEQVAEALKGGVTCVQLREKALPKQDFLAEAVRMKALCQMFSVPFIVNDDVEIAIQCGADGVHIGQRDQAVQAVRAQIGDKMILGVSAQTVEQAVLAEQSGADYLGVGAVFPTATKQDAEAVGYQTLQAICGAVSIPVVAIGGIDEQNLLSLQGSGIDGVAVVSAIFAKREIAAACQRLLALSALAVQKAE